MRITAVSLIVVGLALAALPALAQEGGQTSFTLTAKSQGGDYVWTNPAGETNPTLVVPANAEITITATQGEEGEVPHNIKVGNNAASDNFAAMGESVTYKFTSPASGSVDYVCTIHPVSMKGKVTVAGSAEEKNESPGLALAGTALAFVGAAVLVARRR